jgi:hypothetical protein
MYAGDSETIYNTKEQSQTEFNIKNSRSTESRTIITKNIIHEKIANNQNQKDNDSKVDIYEETSKINVLGKKIKIKSNNQYLNETILSSNKDVGDLSIFLDINTSDIITASDKRSDISVGQENPSKIDNNIIIKRSNEDLDELNSNVNISNKELKIPDTDKDKYEINNYENQMDKKINISIMDKDIRSSYSRSPSLFDDSLNLDTQLCNILEQNVMHLSETEDPKVTSQLNIINTLQKKSLSPNSKNALYGESNMTKIHTTRLQLKNNISSSWDNDSWNDSEQLLKKVVQDNDQNIKEISKYEIKNVNISTKNIKIDIQDNKESIDKINVRKRAATVRNKIPQKSKLLKLATVDSTVTSVIVLNERRMSMDSNKSDSDDIVVGSQHFESSFNDNKNRTKTKLKKIRKMRSQKFTEDTMIEIDNYLNSPVKEISSDITKNVTTKEKTKPKLKEILTRNLLLAANSSIDNICNSKSEIIHSTRSKTKQHEAQANTSNKNLKSKIKAPQSNNKKDSISEITDWNTLNIVKVSNNRATFNLFKRELLKKQNIALALHCETYVNNTNNIGMKICTTNTKMEQKRRAEHYAYENKEIRGIAISWESNIAYYISFSNSQGNSF